MCLTDFEYLLTSQSLRGFMKSRRLRDVSGDLGLNSTKQAELCVRLQKVSLNSSALIHDLEHCRNYWMSRLRTRFGLISLITHKSDRKFILDQIYKAKVSLKKSYKLIGECEKHLFKVCKTRNVEGKFHSAAADDYLDIEREFKELVDEYKVVNSSIPRLNRLLDSRNTALGGAGMVGVYIISTGVVNWSKICYWANSSYGWLTEHLVNPLLAIMGEIFMKKVPQILEKGAVEDAKKSLHNMVNNYMSSKSISANDSSTTTVDLSMVATSYEEQISRPLWNAVNGSLLELMLIQIQVMKVEGLEAMSQLDRLLRENQFNTQLITMIPGLLCLYGLKLLLNRLYGLLTDNSGRLQMSKHNLDILIAKLASVFATEFDMLSNEEKLDFEGKVTHLVYQVSEWLEANRSLVLGSKAQEEFLKEKLMDMLGRSRYTKTEREKFSQICHIWNMGK